MKNSNILLIIILSTIAKICFGQVSIGEKAELDGLKNVKDGSNWTGKDNKNAFLVVVFSAHNCPYTKLYENRLLKMAKSYSEKNVGFVFINSNSAAEDSEENMIKIAKEKGYDFPYLSDKNQQVSGKIGALKTPEVFVFSNKNGIHYLKYKGAIDDNPQVETDTKNNYLRDALDNLLAGKSIVSQEIRAVGCMIK